MMTSVPAGPWVGWNCAMDGPDSTSNRHDISERRPKVVHAIGAERAPFGMRQVAESLSRATSSSRAGPMKNSSALSMCRPVRTMVAPGTPARGRTPSTTA